MQDTERVHILRELLEESIKILGNTKNYIVNSLPINDRTRVLKRTLTERIFNHEHEIERKFKKEVIHPGG